jgi:hypothetical protein
VQQCSREICAAPQRFHEFEVAPRHLVEWHRAPGPLDGGPGQVRNARRLDLAQVAQQRAGRSDRGRVCRLHSESIKRAHAELRGDRIGRARRIELPRGA